MSNAAPSASTAGNKFREVARSTDNPIGRRPARVEPGKFGVDVDGDGAEQADLVRLPPRQQEPGVWVGIDGRSVRTESVQRAL